MTLAIVDASAGAKWILPEAFSEEAAYLLDGRYDLAAPELFALEFANILTNRARRGEFDFAYARDALTRTLAALTLFADAALATRALQLAERHPISVYDATYVALAAREECTLVTADRRLYDHLIAADEADLLWIGDIPATAES
jgi:predicted nucleic acid-binding protein